MSQQNMELTQQPSTKATVERAKSKFTSRKFILSVVGCLTGILGIIGCNDNVIAVCAFVVLEILCILGFIITEGKIDAASVQMAANLATQVADIINQLQTGDNVELPTSDKTVSDNILPTLKP